MTIETKDFGGLLGKTKLSDKQLQAHFTLYQGYVKKLNEVLERLGKADRSTANYSFGEYSELKRREPVAYNGTVLHELYFENLGPAGKTRPDPATEKLLRESYGSVDAWIADMKAAGMSAHGWALTVWDPVTKKLVTDLVHSEHHAGLFANCRVVAALDVWEHAYAIDYGIKKPDYIAAFFESLDWDAVNARVKAIEKCAVAA